MAITTNGQQIAESRCYGIAYDATIHECKVCEAAAGCKKKTEGSVNKIPSKPSNAKPTDITSENGTSVNNAEELTSRPIPADAVGKSTKKKAKPDVKYSEDMPDFKSLSNDELKSLAAERGIDLAQFDKFTNDGIKRMRITMALKKTYQV